jgi:DNA-binding phage protein
MAKKRQFSSDLRRAIESSEKTRYQIHKETGIDQGNLSRFMHGGGGLSIESIDKLCDCLGLRLVSDDQPEKRKGR